MSVKFASHVTLGQLLAPWWSSTHLGRFESNGPGVDTTRAIFFPTHHAHEIHDKSLLMKAYCQSLTEQIIGTTVSYTGNNHTKVIKSCQKHFFFIVERISQFSSRNLGTNKKLKGGIRKDSKFRNWVRHTIQGYFSNEMSAELP